MDPDTADFHATEPAVLDAAAALPGPGGSPWSNAARDVDVGRSLAPKAPSSVRLPEARPQGAGAWCANAVPAAFAPSSMLGRARLRRPPSTRTAGPGAVTTATPWPGTGQGSGELRPVREREREVFRPGRCGSGIRGHGPAAEPRAARGRPTHAVRARVRLAGLAEGRGVPRLACPSCSLECRWIPTDRRGRQARASYFGPALGHRVPRGRPVTRGDGRRRELPGSVGLAVHLPGCGCSGIDSGGWRRARNRH